jgi:hypothetical protein
MVPIAIFLYIFDVVNVVVDFVLLVDARCGIL